MNNKGGLDALAIQSYIKSKQLKYVHLYNYNSNSKGGLDALAIQSNLRSLKMPTHNYKHQRRLIKVSDVERKEAK